MPTVNQGQVIATVWENKLGGKPRDNIFTSRALFYALGEKGFKQQADGGRLIEFTLEYAENTTNQMIGELDLLDTTRIDVFDVARYDWKIAAGTVVFSDLEDLRAAASSGKVDLIAEKLENGRDSHIALLNRQCWGAGAGGNDIDGIQKLIPNVPTTGTVGGINRATFSFWRSRAVSGAKTSVIYDNLRSAMRTCWNNCSLGGVKMKPTAIVGDQATFQGFEGLLIANERIMTADKTSHADAGILTGALMFKDTPVFYDEDAPANAFYFLNREVLKFTYLKGGWMKMKTPVEPANQLASINRIATFGNLGTNGSRHLGVVFNTAS
jgi:hypothetical protein